MNGRTDDRGDGENAGPAPCTSGSTTADHTYTTAGSCSVTLTVEDDDGGLGSATTQLTVTAEENAKGASGDSDCGCNLAATAVGARPEGALGPLLTALFLGAGVLLRSSSTRLGKRRRNRV